jgi:hypothetical protein
MTTSELRSLPAIERPFGRDSDFPNQSGPSELAHENLVQLLFSCFVQVVHCAFSFERNKRMK